MIILWRFFIYSKSIDVETGYNNIIIKKSEIVQGLTKKEKKQDKIHICKLDIFINYNFNVDNDP